MNIKNRLEEYLKENLEIKKTLFARGLFKEKTSAYFEEDFSYESSSNISDYINDNKDDETFQTKLFNLIDKKGLKDSDVYNKVNIDRRLFSKIRSNTNYHPSKDTVILLGIALELSEQELEELLELASYSLPKNNTYDLIIRFCFKESIYNINQINEFLYEHKCKTLN